MISQCFCWCCVALAKKLAARSDKDDLIDKGIVKEGVYLSVFLFVCLSAQRNNKQQTTTGGLLAASRDKLEKEMRADAIARAMDQRPSHESLVASGVTGGVYLLSCCLLSCFLFFIVSVGQTALLRLLCKVWLANWSATCWLTRSISSCTRVKMSRHSRLRVS